MGEHCELMVKDLHIPRGIQDEIALASHRNAAWAAKKGYLAEEILPFHGVNADNLIRPDTNYEVLAKLKPSFDPKNGTITAGNSSQLTDGASAVCLMSEAEALAQGREILGFLTGVEFAAINPDDGLLMAPGLALPRLLKRHGLKSGDIDRFEVHEAFAAQVAANNHVWREGWSKYGIDPIGEVPADRMNVNGGSIAIGHPFAATGARLVHSLANELRRSDQKVGAISVCAAGSMACAMLIRRE
jgi:acetyl-CoA acetyltransferase family protein